MEPMLQHLRARRQQESAIRAGARLCHSGAYLAHDGVVSFQHGKWQCLLLATKLRYYWWC